MCISFHFQKNVIFLGKQVVAGEEGLRSWMETFN